MNRSDWSLSSALSGTFFRSAIAHFLISRLISEPLSANAFDHLHGALLIVHAQPNPSIMPEIELCQVAMQVARAAVPVSAAHATLEDREVALDGVGVDVATHVFLGAVVHNAMLCEAGQLVLIHTAAHRRLSRAPL